MVQVYALTQLWDPVGHWSVVNQGHFVQSNLPDLCYGTPCTTIYDQGPGLAGASSSIYLDGDQLGIKDFPLVEVYGLLFSTYELATLMSFQRIQRQSRFCRVLQPCAHSQIRSSDQRSNCARWRGRL
jgi:hypothetical protein